MNMRKELDESNLSVHQKVDAIFAGTQALLQAALPIRNVIIALGDNRTELEDALAGTYYRMCLLVESLTRLNKKQDFQVALHCARCLYELHLDAVDLTRDPTLLAKFKAFTFVARFAAAEKLINELNAQGITDPAVSQHERTFVADPVRRARFNTELATHWPTAPGKKQKAPLNWMNESLPDRAKRIGKNELLRYRQLYSFLCWYSHAGVVGIANISGDGLEASMGMAHGHSQEFFFATTNLVAKQFDIYTANPLLKSPVDQYKQTTAKVMLQYLKKLQSSES
jgi:hypothetical protein